MKTKVVGNCISQKEVVDENYQATFEPGTMHVGHAFGGMKAKMSFDVRLLLLSLISITFIFLYTRVIMKAILYK